VDNVDPREIYLSTFTEKAALQLREGLRGLLALASEETKKPYDIAKMYVGTVHSLCQRMLVERDFQPDRRRGRAPSLLDELDQYLMVNRRRTWHELLAAGGFDPDDAHARIGTYFAERSKSKHAVTTACMALFNRLSEECVETEKITTDDKELAALLRMYRRYRSLLDQNSAPLTDFSLLQQEAFRILESNPAASKHFRHVIVDEYQDTNAVQERIFFRLAAGYKNLCVVGDDDQALYRFRGATVENFVQFPERCAAFLKTKPRTIALDTNYRSRTQIVSFYNDFLAECDWTRPGKRGGAYRVMTKKIRAYSEDAGVSVVASAPSDPESVCSEIATLVRKLIRGKRVSDPNQIAFLYPSLKTDQVKRMIVALQKVGLQVYAPRAAPFLETGEATDVLGVFALVLGRPARGVYRGDYAKYYDWLDRAEVRGKVLVAADRQLSRFVAARQNELARSREDYRLLLACAERNKWDIGAAYAPDRQKRALLAEPGVSADARRRMSGKRFDAAMRIRAERGDAVPLKYVLRRASSLDWSFLDLFYQITLFEHFAAMFDAAQRTEAPDEGPVCNLALLTQYLARFVEQRVPIIAGDLLHEDLLARLFFGSYLYALHRRGESEYEDADDPFPKGRIPFLTVHQSKGLEFPVVVLGNPRKNSRLQRNEEIIAPLLKGSADREPLDRMAQFDTMRVFYVALSRAKNLLVLANYQSRGNWVNPEFKRLISSVPEISALKVASVPIATDEQQETPRIYSYSGDFMAYLRCARQYLIFRKFGFVPSRSQTMIFGNLVHRTLEDIHQHLIAAREAIS
jgi:DNA helicase-2/ATP-dependent DNA helicase PcrA